MLERDSSLLTTSLYFHQLESYLKHIDRRNIHVILLEDFKINPGRELERICEFLAIPFEFPTHEFPVINRGKETPRSLLSPACHAEILKFLAPDKENLEAFLHRKIDWDLSVDRWCQAS